MFSVINRIVSAFMWFCGATGNFVQTYSFASAISKFSSIFEFAEEDHVMCLKRLEFN